MTRWALLVLMVLMLGRVLVLPATPIPVYQLSSHNFPQATSCSTALERTLATTTGPSASWGRASPGPHPGPRITLSLDVPLGLLKILLEQAQIRAAKERAAANARILAHVGRR
ncbi:PREDICTED: urocortin-2 [Chrysochloris asiatica]|uniref:Urocortin-2 n=1 Tax=Chrysochloris asiatica TaxID=185453 RepID=A0A9B0X070_CHRAS|nr:PREDICTED: urocortin-2 [Chrysochloris asiatica]